MLTMLVLALRIVAVVLSLLLVLAGIGVIVVGLVRLMRTRKAGLAYRPSYSEAVEVADAGEGLSADYEDQPQYLTLDIVPDPDPRTEPEPLTALLQSRRRGIVIVVTGVLLSALGVLLVNITLGWVS